MPDNLIQMQHASKGPASFTHGHVSVESDEDGIITIPSEMSGQAKAHGFMSEVAPKVMKSLAKDAGNAKDKKKPSEAEDAGNAKDGAGK